MTAALYLRCSSEQQAKQDTSIPAQRKELQAFAARNKHSVVCEYEDAGESGTTDKRPGFQRLLADSTKKPRPFDAVLIYDTARFGRDAWEAAGHKRDLRKRGISIVSATQPLDDSSPEGKFMEGVYEHVDQLHSDKLSVTVARGQREVVERGFARGGTPATGFMFGKRIDGNNERSVLVPDPKLAPMVKEAFERVAAGDTIFSVAKWLNESKIPTRRAAIWTYRLVYELLRRRTYVGEVAIKGKTLGECPAIISKELFERAQLQMKRRKTAPKTIDAHVYLLNGVARCSRCNTPLTIMSTFKGKYRSYLCRSKNNGNSCGAPNVAVEKLEQAFLGSFAWYERDRSNPTIDSTNIKAESAKIARLESELDNVAEAIAGGAMRGSPTMQAKLEQKAQAIEHELSTAKVRLHNLEQIDDTAPKSPRWLVGKTVPTGAEQRARVKLAIRNAFAEIIVDLEKGEVVGGLLVGQTREEAARMDAYAAKFQEVVKNKGAAIRACKSDEEAADIIFPRAKPLAAASG